MAGGQEKEVKQLKTTEEAKKTKDKKKKGKDAAVEAITNALSALSPDQQVATLLSKYAELLEENRVLQSSCRTFERTAQQAQKDKDRVELEHSKAVLTRSRLESLCRELQRQNKIIKDENLTRLKEEEEKRKDVSSQFTSTLSEISHLMEENTQSNSKLREENKKMAVRLQDLVVQHERREDHVEKVLKQREIEAQLAEAKLAKLQIEVREQKEKMLIERKGLLEELSLLQDKLQEKALTEISLRTQLNTYTEKFEEFQETLNKSNQIFNGFKKEIDVMSKTIKTLEKETKTWREKCESANVALCQMFSDRSQLEAKIESRTKQNTQLQSLCRALQQQVKELRTQIRNQSISETPNSTPPNDIFAKEISREKSIKGRGSQSTASSPGNTLQRLSNFHECTEEASLMSTASSTEVPPLACVSSGGHPHSDVSEESASHSSSLENSPTNPTSLTREKKAINSEDQNSTDREANQVTESELDMEAVD